ncbi:MAG: hypothetical protein CM15mP6_2790 [Methanobacteriota archaeon]|nr:MAG: hypothetical protein CM15mP6_2790 [Euryarchaeota archaeon]
MIEYNVSSGDSTSIVIERNIVWDDSNLLSGNSIADIAVSDDILYIATSNSGIDRFDISLSRGFHPGLHLIGYLLTLQSVWLSPRGGFTFWASSRSRCTIPMSCSSAAKSPYPIWALRILETASALGQEDNLVPPQTLWHNRRLLGTMGRILGDVSDGSFPLVSSPSIEDPITAIIDDGEAGEFWLLEKT